MNNTKDIGLYLHIPFCRSKCPYCDFYSMRADESVKEQYVNVLKSRIAAEMADFICKADTLYIGGGTPSVLGASKIGEIVKSASPFLTNNAEITVECNPYALSSDFFKELAQSGVNRISMGLQSAVDDERKALGRLSNAENVKNAVIAAQNAGISNISLDVMLGIPNQTEKTLSETLDFCLFLGIPHISTYILKLEEGTYFYKNQESLSLPDDDAVAEMYLTVCETLEKNGIMQYEISNFAKPNFHSRHNLKYWNCEEYLGLGPAAHSFLDGKRFYFERDLNAFLSGAKPIPDDSGGDFTEYAMLKLRLSEGLLNSETEKRFGHKIPDEMIKKSAIFADNGFMESDEMGLRLTKKGFLLSNSILAEIL
ncbi:MAG: radical SAM family heme chaperone HemW [Oscillospiraceae bacterium]|nr:radical SAM family heme chaperone HemW [Oscillospiraceae bacterium]